MITFNYFDGSNNHYKITETQLIFDPMKPEFSSTGEYDGGVSQTIPISPLQFQELQVVIMNAFNAVEAHVNNRSKGTCLLKMQEDNERASCILEMNSLFKIDIEKVLKGLLAI